MKKIDEKNIKNLKKELIDWKWIIIITIYAFVISLVFSSFSELLIKNVNIIIGIIIVLIFVGIGIIFDMIGVATSAADEKKFHSMNAQKVKGSSRAVYFIKNADKVSSFCNDVVGDICGIVSGSAGVIIASSFAIKFNTNIIITNLMVTALISSLTIGGKAIFKSFAINKSDIIVHKFAKFVNFFCKIK